MIWPLLRLSRYSAYLPIDTTGAMIVGVRGHHFLCRSLHRLLGFWGTHSWRGREFWYRRCRRCGLSWPENGSAAVEILDCASGERR